MAALSTSQPILRSHVMVGDLAALQIMVLQIQPVSRGYIQGPVLRVWYWGYTKNVTKGTFEALLSANRP